MIWATTAEIRNYLGEDLPPDFGEAALTRALDKAVASIERIIIRWPVLDDAEEHAANADVRKNMITAVAETIKARRDNDALTASLGPLAPILVAGGSVATKTLSASTGGTSKSGGGAELGTKAPRVPLDAIDALSAAGLIGGSGRTW